jgi:hypothetical protein
MVLAKNPSSSEPTKDQRLRAYQAESEAFLPNRFGVVLIKKALVEATAVSMFTNQLFNSFSPKLPLAKQ